ncbi:hypothetical protein PWO93_14860 [Lactiplantibacillus paraplantarum]|nr:hypothetical protein [Lactiplantibacillus paraplantarum]WEE35949.1 hypothetical protein PWO93_14860 [Lactiplantibacillus paraplantarum]
MAKIIVACGSGVASSELVVKHITDFFVDANLSTTQEAIALESTVVLCTEINLNFQR